MDRERVKPIGIVNFEQGATALLREIVETIFPPDQLIGRRDMEDIRKTAYNIYCRRRQEGNGETQDPIENWTTAMQVVAVNRFFDRLANENRN